MLPGEGRTLTAVTARTPLVVGFDLDLTLIDTAAGFRQVLLALGAELEAARPWAQRRPPGM